MIDMSISDLNPWHRSKLEEYGLPVGAGLGAAGLTAAALIARNPLVRTGLKYHLAKDLGLGTWKAPIASAAREADVAQRIAQLDDHVRGIAELLRARGLDPAKARIGVAGISGSGKGTLASRLAEELGMQHIELDPVVFGRATMQDMIEGRAPGQFSGTLADQARFAFKPSSSRIDDIFEEQGFPEGKIYDYVQAVGQGHPDRYDALIHVDRPLDQIREDLLYRGYGAFSPELMDAEFNQKATRAAFDIAASAPAHQVGPAAVKIRPSEGFKAEEHLQASLRNQGIDVDESKPFWDRIQKRVDPSRVTRPGYVGDLRLGQIARAGALTGATGTASGLGAYAAQEKLSSAISDRLRLVRHLTPREEVQRLPLVGSALGRLVPKSPSFTYDVELGSTPVGRWVVSDSGQVSAASLRPEFQGQGIAKKVYGKLMRMQPNVALASDTVNLAPSVPLWERMKRRGYGTWKNPSQRTDETGIRVSFDGPNFAGALPLEARISAEAQGDLLPAEMRKSWARRAEEAAALPDLDARAERHAKESWRSPHAVNALKWIEGQLKTRGILDMGLRRES